MHIKRVIIVCVSFAILMTLVLVMYSDTVFLYKPLARGAVSALTPAKNLEFSEFFTKKHSEIVKEFIAGLKDINMSAVGNVIFRNQIPPGKRPKNYKILIWKQGEFLEARHIYSFQDTKRDPFGQCSVSNCELTYEDADIMDADAVVFMMQRLYGVNDLPVQEKGRPPGQRWVFLTDECPVHTFLYADNNWKQYEGYFNWSMSYRLESDVPVPYGRTTALTNPIVLEENLGFQNMFSLLVPNVSIKRRDVLVAVLMSNCNPSNQRLNYVKELEKYITVHMYGGCGTEFKNVCPKTGTAKNSRYGGSCPQMDRYLFYLSFENANCKQYISEKPFWNAYRTGAVPIVMGPSSEDCKLQLPPNSYLHVNDFSNAEELAKHILFMNSTLESTYLHYHEWRKHFEVKNEHGLFGAPSFHYCRLCEALNYNNDEIKVLNDLSYLLDPKINCW